MTSAFAALESRAFCRYWIASICSNTGSWMQMITVPFVIDQITHSTAWVGVAVFCTFFPLAAISPAAGVWTDRYPRRTVLLVSQAAMGLGAAGLLALWSSGAATTAALLGCVVLSSLGNGLLMAANIPFVSDLVPEKHYIGAVRLLMTQTYAARASGPALAAVILTAFGPSTAFAVNLVSFVPLVLVVLMTRTMQEGRGTTGRAWAQFSEGFRYARGRREVWIAVVMMSGVGALGVAMVHLVEPLVRHVHHRSAGDYGLLVTTYGVGGVAGAVVTVMLGDRCRRSAMALIGLTTTSGCVIALSAGSFVVSIPVMFALGLASVVSTMALVVSVHSNVEDAFRGRSNALLNVTFGGATPIGALIGGLLGAVFGLRSVLLGAGLLGFALLGAVYRPFGRLRPLDRSSAAMPDSAGAASVSERPASTAIG